MDPEIQATTEKVREASAFLGPLRREIEKVIVGQTAMIDALLIGILTRGHVLLEGVPGLAKTLAVRTLASCIHTSFQRIQFTPDLLPSDLIGTMIFNPAKGTFEPRQGPIFANLILADEINRAPAKVQSALLEAMEERQVTIGDHTYPMADPFLVLATQNPIEQEGTYPLPEAQVDRFMLKVVLDYPRKDEERRILDRMSGLDAATANRVVDVPQILAAREAVQHVYMDDRIKDYVVNLVQATRRPQDFGLKLDGMILYGASPRATPFLTRAARAHAFLQGRGFATPEDVKAVALEVLRHRVILTYEAEAEEVSSDDVVRKVFDAVEVP